MAKNLNLTVHNFEIKYYKCFVADFQGPDFCWLLILIPRLTNTDPLKVPNQLTGPQYQCCVTTWEHNPAVGYINVEIRSTNHTHNVSNIYRMH